MPHDDDPVQEMTEAADPSSVEFFARALDREVALSRFSGPLDEESRLRARLANARAAGDAESEHEAASNLARLLMSKEADPALAIELAEGALSLRDDPSLREELVHWLTGIGQPLRAAEALRGLVPFDSPRRAAELLVHVGLLLARGDDLAGALAAFQEAGRLDPEDPAFAELAGALAGSALFAAPPEMAARAFLRAASRHERAGNEDGRLESLRRAFEAAPDLEEAAETLAAAERARDREETARHIERLHLRALAPKGGPMSARARYLERMQAAIEASSWPEALEAALDAKLDAVLEGPEAERFDELLSRAGLYELLAARLELRAAENEGPTRARLFFDLARLCTGPLANPARAVEAWFSAYTADPTNEEALRALRAHAVATRDDGLLVEAWLRATSDERLPASTKAECLRELADLAEARLGDPTLALFALRRLDPAAASAAEDRLVPQARAQDEAIAVLRRQLATSEGRARIEPLQKLSRLLRGRPEEAESLGQALLELAQSESEDPKFATWLALLATRTGRLDFLESLVDSTPSASKTHARARLVLMRAAHARGELRDALVAVKPLLREQPGNAAACYALVLASRTGADEVRAEALEAMAALAPTELRSTLLTAAAEAWSTAGNAAEARTAAEAARSADFGSARATMVLASLPGEALDDDSLLAISRALEICPRSEHYRALSRAASKAGQRLLALVWARRWLALRPGDPEAIEEIGRLAIASKDVEALEGALSLLLERPLPARIAAPLAARLLEAIHGVAASRAPELCRRALDVLGPVEGLEGTTLAVAEAENDVALRVTVIERSSALHAQAPHRLLELVDLRRALGDEVGSIRALGRALSAGIEAEHVLARLPESCEGGPSELIVPCLEIRADAELALGDAHAEDAACVLRQLGAARWDLAEDRDGAVLAWFHAGLLDSAHGATRLARDLLSFGDQGFALDALESLAKSSEDPKAAAFALSLLARIAAVHGEHQRALTAAEDALGLDASRLEALAALEVAAEAMGASELLDAAYRRFADQDPAPERRRAAHVRAARKLDALNRGDLAYVHATAALQALAPDRPTLALFVDITKRTGMADRAVAALEAALPKLTSQVDADVAIAIASAALGDLDHPALANAAIARALALGGGTTELGALLPYAPQLAREANAAVSWIEAVIERQAAPQEKVASSVVQLAGAVAEQLDDPSIWGRLLLQAGRASSPPAPPPTLEPVLDPLAASPSASASSPAAVLVPARAPAPVEPPVSEPAAPPPLVLTPASAPAPLPPLVLTPARAQTGQPQELSLQIPASGAAAARAPAGFVIPPLVPSLPEPAPPPSSKPAVAETEMDLLQALRGGSLEAGDRLVERCLAQGPARSRDVMLIRHLQAGLVPGDRERLRQLRDAAADHRDGMYARAVEHVLRAFDSVAGRLAPPALESQPEQPDLVAKLVFRSPPVLALEALGIICEGAPQLFRRDLTTYGFASAERIPVGSRAPIGRAYTIVARMLGLTRVPLLQARASKKLGWVVALLGPPVALLSGDATEDSPELRYEIATALASAMPAHALLASLPPDRAQTVIAAIMAAYGPPNQMPRYPAVAAVAESLWQLLPARAERYMRDLCAQIDLQALDYATMLGQQRMLVRRAGLLVTGDIELAISRYFADERTSPPISLSAPGGLAAACTAHPTIANLVRLAISPEYAKVRWHVPATQPQAPPPSSQSGRLGS